MKAACSIWYADRSEMEEGGSMAEGKRGFASMDREKQKQIASQGGKAAHAKGSAHEFTSDEARAAGRKGGLAVSLNREHMSTIGREGGKSRGRNVARRLAEARALQEQGRSEEVRTESSEAAPASEGLVEQESRSEGAFMSGPAESDRREAGSEEVEERGEDSERSSGGIGGPDRGE
jgi:general stress protein YciG